MRTHHVSNISPGIMQRPRFLPRGSIRVQSAQSSARLRVRNAAEQFFILWRGTREWEARIREEGGGFLRLDLAKVESSLHDI